MKKTAKEVILERIRHAVATAAEPPEATRSYRQHDERDRTIILEELVDRLVDYKAQVTQTNEAGLAHALAVACRGYDVARLVVPVDLPEHWLPTEVALVRDEPALSVDDLKAGSAVLTGCAMAIAQTGTIILDGGTAQGRRVLSLVPDIHLCVVRAEQVVGLVPEAVARLGERATQPITLISGPSATSDIELSRVEGVHGPRTLHVFIVKEA